jgi:TPR repeat protein
MALNWAAVIEYLERGGTSSTSSRDTWDAELMARINNGSDLTDTMFVAGPAASSDAVRELSQRHNVDDLSAMPEEFASLLETLGPDVPESEALSSSSYSSSSRPDRVVGSGGVESAANGHLGVEGKDRLGLDEARSYLSLSPESTAYFRGHAGPEYAVSAKEDAIARMQTGDGVATGDCYSRGWGGLPFDPMQAVRCYQDAADQGNLVAMHRLGHSLRFGIGTAKDLDKAAYYYQKSAEGGEVVGQHKMGQFHKYGMGPVKKDAKRAAFWFRKAAKQGNAASQYWLGRQLEKGVGVEKDEKKAAALYRKSAEGGSAKSQAQLGLCFEKGVGVEKDWGQAFFWHQKGAEGGSALAQFKMGLCYEHGWVVEEDHKQAVAWYLKAAKQGYAKSQFKVGLCFENGLALKRDEKKAMAFYRKAANQGHAYGQFELGHCYRLGKGVDRDFQRAAMWYQKAAEQGLEAPRQWHEATREEQTRWQNVDPGIEHLLRRAEEGAHEIDHTMVWPPPWDLPERRAEGVVYAREKLEDCRLALLMAGNGVARKGNETGESGGDRVDGPLVEVEKVGALHGAIKVLQGHTQRVSNNGSPAWWIDE